MALVIIVDTNGWRAGHTTQAAQPDENQMVDLQFRMYAPFEPRDITDLTVLFALQKNLRNIETELAIEDMRQLQRFLTPNGTINQ